MVDKNKSDDEVVDEIISNEEDVDNSVLIDEGDTQDPLQEMESRYKRAIADYQNLLRQTAKEKMDFAKYANENLLSSFLPIYDNLKTAIAHAGDEKDNNWLTGVKYVVKQFADALANVGVEEIKTAGEKFDHATMEAVETQETDEDKDDIVVRELKSGYKLNGKLIEPARVVVYKKK